MARTFKVCVVALALCLANTLTAIAQSSEEIEHKIKALEDARRAGILSDEEFDRKKSELEAKLQPSKPLDEATKQKLKALDDAHKAGILSDEEYARKKGELTGKGAGQAAPSTQEKGKTYRHPVGFTFWYPESWTVKESDGYLQLIPPNPGANADGPTEAYLAMAENVAQSGITKPDDPIVIDALNQKVLGFLPFVQRVDKIVPIQTTAAKGVMFEWRGKNPKGNDVIARCFVSIVKGYGVTLFAVGLKEQVEKRDSDLRKTFSSCGLEEGKTDPKLVGNWSLLSTASLENNSPYETAWSKARSVTDTNKTYRFQADGTWVKTSKHHTLVGAGGVWIEDKGETSDKGKWNAADGTLSLMGEDNSWGTYKYQVVESAQGRQLRLVSGNSGEIYGEIK